MLTPDQLEKQAEASTDALVALERDMRIEMVKHLQSLKTLDAVDANKSARELMVKLRKVILKHDDAIKAAILKDVQAANLLNIYSELEALQKYGRYKR